MKSSSALWRKALASHGFNISRDALYNCQRLMIIFTFDWKREAYTGMQTEVCQISH